MVNGPAGTRAISGGGAGGAAGGVGSGAAEELSAGLALGRGAALTLPLLAVWLPEAAWLLAV